MTQAHLQSATALTFHATTFHPVARDGQQWLPAAEIAAALGYSREDKISRLYDRHAAEFSDRMTALVETPISGASGNLRATVRIFSLRGAHLLGMFARTARAAEFRRWVLDILDAQTATDRPGTTSPSLPAPAAFDLRAAMRADNLQPTVRLPPDVQTAINRQAWAMAHDAYELCREHLARRVAYSSEFGFPERVLDRKTALATIAETTLDMAMAPAHFNALRVMQRMAATAAALAIECRDKIAAEIEHITASELAP